MARSTALAIGMVVCVVASFFVFVRVALVAKNAPAEISPTVAANAPPPAESVIPTNVQDASSNVYNARDASEGPTGTPDRQGTPGTQRQAGHPARESVDHPLYKRD